MLKVNLENTPLAKVVILSGELVLEHVKELKKVLLNEIKKNNLPLHINIIEIQKIDIFGLQLICATHRMSENLKQNFVLIGKESQVLKSAVDLYRLSRHGECSFEPSCPWEHN